MTLTSNFSESDLQGEWQRPMFKALVVLGLTFGALGTWSLTAKLDSAVVASGRIVVDGERKVVQHLEGGIVAEILVTEDDYVSEGDVLLRVNSSQVEASAAINNGQLETYRAEEARLIAEINNHAEIDFPDSISASERADQINRFLESRNARLNEVSILEQQIRQAQTQIAGLETQEASAETQLSSLEGEYVQIRPLLERRLVAANRGLDLERRIEEARARLASFASERARLADVIAETELRIEQVWARARETASARLVEVRSAIEELDVRSVVAGELLSRSEIRAPRSGRVVGLEVHTIGQVIAPGATILEIVPDDGGLIVSSRMSPLDVTHVHPGLEAEVRLPSFKQRETPLALGVVRSVSADVMIDEVTRESYYELRISVEDGAFPESIRSALVAGMPAEVIVATGERTVFEYLTQPLSDAMRVGMREQ